MTIEIKDLAKPFYENSETNDADYFEAYRSHKKAGKYLLQGKMTREAFLSLHIAVECLLKGIYVCVRYHYFKDSSVNNQLRILLESTHKEKEKKIIVEDLLDPKKFDHDISRLSHVIKNLFSEFDKGIFATKYAKLTTAITSSKRNDFRFSDERYKSPKPEQNFHWETTSNDLLNALEDIEHILPHLFKGVQNECN